jgi:hypothetical protein
MSEACGSNILCCNDNSPFDDECGELCKLINPRSQDFIKILKIVLTLSILNQYACVGTIKAVAVDRKYPFATWV